MGDYSLNKFLSLLNNLSDTDLRDLGNLLAQPKVCEKLSRLIRTTLELRQSEKRNKYQIYNKSGIEEAPRSKTELKKQIPVKSDLDDIMHVNGLKARFFSLLEDRKLFPSNRDVLTALNKEFDCDIPYKYSSKHGRRDIINKCWIHLSGYPRQVRRRMIKNFVDRMLVTNSQRDEYRELFRILANHE
jgi:hypothetical protein